ncbi:DUF1934 domain-containing protein [Clostridium gasigenes]|uniref:DUF1934 domain-containing protein n=1 Tax=Clostridium gasigenes TaxID=94869 RepID=A0A1H0VUL4_9CLOT|nr:DUF1934 domain-containing protein [Clostridium gasigenes]MBB6622592.1 DUF1934 domain-containing protein [Clostridium gasigenes]MBB6714191.1 DUF1934 domain-containing protein [Clostridium gasigenes]MBU3088524.1 DUF1934 domain-containing protein [Clostridium gasigenes]MBU3103880.1 DUF1934 domain-containing protein [Clostridium gasigenes]MBU3132779.1 DUF1934 domain-containing protein [Clostridium gasigenes]
MKKKAIISVKSISELDKKDSIEVITPGDFIIEDGIFKAIYKETELSGMKGTVTTINIFEENFILERTGTTNTKMEFELDKTAISLYSTPYGVMDLQIHTEELEINVDENGGDIRAKYNMGFSGQPPIITEIWINIKL